MRRGRDGGTNGRKDGRMDRWSNLMGPSKRSGYRDGGAVGRMEDGGILEEGMDGWTDGATGWDH